MTTPCTKTASQGLDNSLGQERENMPIKKGDLRGKTYKDSRGRTIRIVGADMLWPDGSRMLVEREDGKQWGVSTDNLLDAITVEECRKRDEEAMRATAPRVMPTGTFEPTRPTADKREKNNDIDVELIGALQSLTEAARDGRRIPEWLDERLQPIEQLLEKRREAGRVQNR
jgi:hypothetical protein